jgi:hypothetical protein
MNELDSNFRTVQVAGLTVNKSNETIESKIATFQVFLKGYVISLTILQEWPKVFLILPLDPCVRYDLVQCN